MSAGAHRGSPAGKAHQAEPWSTAITATTDERVFVRGVALDEAIVRVTRADGESGPWSMEATRHAPSRAASSSVAGSPRQSRSSIAGNGSRPIASSRARPRTKTRSSVVAVIAVDQGSA